MRKTDNDDSLYRLQGLEGKAPLRSHRDPVTQRRAR
jgi:hypothetical protein